MQKLQRILLFSLVLGLAFNPGNFYNAAPDFTQAAKQIAEVKSISIKVVPFQASSSVQIAKEAQGALPGNKICYAPSLTDSNFVQDQGFINFNQPADCLSVKPGLVTAYSALAVEPLFTVYAKVVVLAFPAVLASPSLKTPATAGGSPLSLPVVSVVFAILLAGQFDRLKKPFRQTAGARILQHKFFSLAELMVFRC